MSTTAHPHPPGDSDTDRTAAALEQAYPDWAVTATAGRFTARHRREEYDARREQWGMIATTVVADTAQQLRDRLDTQQELRRAEAAR
ncbi:hypothetical protein GCM10027570_08420 [Streptomonospora sediminis]